MAVRGTRAPILSVLLLPLAGPAGETSSLSVRSSDGWAEVDVDGLPWGLAPVRRGVSPGNHEVCLGESPYQVRRCVVVWVDVDASQSIVLTRAWKPSVLVIRGRPVGAAVFLDAVPVASGAVLVAGPDVEVEVRQDGGYNVELRIADRHLTGWRVRRCLERPCVLPGERRILEWLGARGG